VKIGTDEVANIASGHHFQRHSCCGCGKPQEQPRLSRQSSKLTESWLVTVLGVSSLQVCCGRYHGCGKLPSQEGLRLPPALKDGPLAWSLSSKANWPTTARLASIQLDRASSNYLAPPLVHTSSDWYAQQAGSHAISSVGRFLTFMKWTNSQ
jgi:hypothetical protein